MNREDKPNEAAKSEPLDEVANLLALGLLRLRARHVGGRKKREISRDNCLEVPPGTRPTAVDL
jgi:hypothetical protein